MFFHERLLVESASVVKYDGNSLTRGGTTYLHGGHSVTINALHPLLMHSVRIVEPQSSSKLPRPHSIKDIIEEARLIRPVEDVEEVVRLAEIANIRPRRRLWSVLIETEASWCVHCVMSVMSVVWVVWMVRVVTAK